MKVLLINCSPVRNGATAEIIEKVRSYPSYWADIPGQFKAFIDRCTPWCNTHEPHATIGLGKKGYTIALRTGANEKECHRIVESIEHFYGHLEIEAKGKLCLSSVKNKTDVEERAQEIKDFCSQVDFVHYM